MAVVALVQFAKGGYLLAYLPGAVIALLLAPAALMRTRSPAAGRWARTWGVLATLAVLAIAAFGAERFLLADGVLPGPTHARHPAGSG